MPCQCFGCQRGAASDDFFGCGETALHGFGVTVEAGEKVGADTGVETLSEYERGQEEAGSRGEELMCSFVSHVECSLHVEGRAESGGWSRVWRRKAELSDELRFAGDDLTAGSRQVHPEAR